MESVIACHPPIALKPSQPAERGSKPPGSGSGSVSQQSWLLAADLSVNLCFPISALLTPSFDPSKVDQIPLPN